MPTLPDLFLPLDPDEPTRSTVRWLVWHEVTAGEPLIAANADKALQAARARFPDVRITRVQSLASYALELEQDRIAARHQRLGLRTPAGQERDAVGAHWDPRRVRPTEEAA